MAFTDLIMINVEQKEFTTNTGPGRYILNVPGNAGDKPAVFNDPQLRMQKWGGNLQGVYNGHPIDIESDLKNVEENYTNFAMMINFLINVKTFKQNYQKITYL